MFLRTVRFDGEGELCGGGWGRLARRSEHGGW